MSFASHNAPIYALCPSEKEGIFFSGGGDKIVAQWDVSAGEQLPFTVRTESPIYALEFQESTPHLFIGCSDGKIHVVDTQNRQEVKAWALHQGSVFDMKLDGMRNRLLAVSGDGVLSVWDLTDMSLLRTIPLSSGKLRQLALSPDNSMIAIADNQGPVHVLDAESYNTRATLFAHADGSTSVAWHPAKPVLISGGKDAYLRCWNVADNFKEILGFAAHLSSIYSIVFLPGNTQFATCSRDKTIKIWDAQTLDPLKRIDFAQGGHKHSVNKLLVSKGQLISAGDDRSINVFSL